MTLVGIIVTGASGSAPTEVFSCKIRRSATFVKSEGFGWSDGTIWVINVVATAENKPAYRGKRKRLRYLNGCNGLEEAHR